MTVKNLLLMSVALAFLAVPSALQADCKTFEPRDADLGDLDHYWYYKWGIDTNLPDDMVVTSARLRFDNIRNWDNNPNVLYVHLLDWAREGVRKSYDWQGGGDAFAGQGIELVTYYNLPNSAQDLEYVFNAGQLDVLRDYIANDGRIGLGFDPDCHFWNDGVSLDICYTDKPIPEPATMSLLGAGGALLALRRRKRRQIA